MKKIRAFKERFIMIESKKESLWDSWLKAHFSDTDTSIFNREEYLKGLFVADDGYPSSGLNGVVGFTREGTPVRVNLREPAISDGDGPHIGFGGATRKETLAALKNYMVSLTLHTSPEKMKIVVPEEHVRYALEGIENLPHYQAVELQGVGALLDERREALHSAEKAGKDIDLPTLVMVLTGVAVNTQLGGLLAVGRALGVHIICVQNEELEYPLHRHLRSSVYISEQGKALVEKSPEPDISVKYTLYVPELDCMHALNLTNS